MIRMIPDDAVRRFLGSLYPALLRRFGPRPSWSAATVLAFASLLRKDGAAGYIVLPWQVAKQWALERGEAPPRECPDDYGASMTFRFRWALVHEVAALFSFPPVDAARRMGVE